MSRPRSVDRSAEPSGDLVQSNWLLSFGDLLTLVLCFFLALLSSGAVGARVTGRNETAAGAPPPPAAPGTTIAEVEGGARTSIEKAVLLTPEGASDERARDILNDVLTVSSRHGLPVTIEACAEKVPEAWFAASRRALELRRVVAEELGGGRRILVRVLGNACGEIRTPASPGAVARVTVNN